MTDAITRTKISEADELIARKIAEEQAEVVAAAPAKVETKSSRVEAVATTGSRAEEEARAIYEAAVARASVEAANAERAMLEAAAARIKADEAREELAKLEAAAAVPAKVEAKSIRVEPVIPAPAKVEVKETAAQRAIREYDARKNEEKSKKITEDEEDFNTAIAAASVAYATAEPSIRDATFSKVFYEVYTKPVRSNSSHSSAMPIGSAVALATAKSASSPERRPAAEPIAAVEALPTAPGGPGMNVSRLLEERKSAPSNEPGRP
jgi:hypothetical protein